MKSQPDRYVSRGDLAKIFGFQSVRDIDRLVENGIITPYQRGTGKTHTTFDLLPTVTDYIRNLRDKATGRARRETETDLKNQKLKAEIALKESQGELHKLRTEIAQGRYMSIDEVKLDYTKFFLVFKQFATAIPARLISMLAGTVEPVEARRLETMLNSEVQNQLKAFVLAARTPDAEPEGGEEKNQKPDKEKETAEKKRKSQTRNTAAKRATAKKSSTRAKKK